MFGLRKSADEIVQQGDRFFRWRGGDVSRLESLFDAVVALADLDYNAWIDQVSTEWDGAIPFTLVYNQNDRRVKLGEIDSYEDLKKLVHEMM